MALLFTLLCGLTVAMLAYFGYYFTRGYFVEGTEAAIDTEIKYVTAFPEAIDGFGPQESVLYAPFGPNGETPADIPQDLSIMREGVIVFDHPDTGRRFAAKIHTDEDGDKTLVGVDITKASQNYRFMMMLSLAGIAMVGLVIAGSFTISVFVVQGTNNIARTAREIMTTGDLSRRITVHRRWDDLSSMADTLNALFDRIEQLMSGVRHVSDNIAHDLRTPLMRMKAPIETLAARYPEDEAVQRLSLECDRVLSIFNALLRISRLESEQRRSHFQTVDLETILSDLVEFYEPLADEKGLLIKSSLRSYVLHGDRDLLFQAFSNVIDNAVKYTSPGGRIDVTLAVDDGGAAILDIHNTGSSIPHEDAGRIFERFYRSDTSRSEPGLGLGLSLAAAIVDLHGGTVRAVNKDGGVSIITVL